MADPLELAGAADRVGAVGVAAGTNTRDDSRGALRTSGAGGGTKVRSTLVGAATRDGAGTAATEAVSALTIRSLVERGAGLAALDLTLSVFLTIRAVSVVNGALSITGACGTLALGAVTTTGMRRSGAAAAGGVLRVGVVTTDGALGV
jgi:hypothetical protein